jgi:hypothetical protein
MDSFFSNTPLLIDTVQHGKNNENNVSHDTQDTVKDLNTERAVETSRNGKSRDLCSIGIISGSISSDTDHLSRVEPSMAPTREAPMLMMLM